MSDYTSGYVPPANVIEAAKDACVHLLVLGEDRDGGLYFASTTGDKAALLLWLEEFKYKLLSGAFDVNDDDC